MKLAFLNSCPGLLCLCSFAPVSLCLHFCLSLSFTYCPSVLSHLLRASNNNHNLTPYRSLYGKSFARPQPSHRVTCTTSLTLAASCSRTLQKHDAYNKSSVTPVPVLFVVTPDLHCLSVHLYLLSQSHTHTHTYTDAFCPSLFFRPAQTYVVSLTKLSMRCVFAGCSWVPSIHTHATTTARGTRWVNSKQEQNTHIEMYWAVTPLKFSFLPKNTYLCSHAEGQLGAIT